MSLETATYVANLVVTNPDGGDQAATLEDHIRLVKATLVRTFPKFDGPCSLSALQVAYVGDLSASVQAQLNALRDGTATAANAINARYATSASNAAVAVGADSASFATLAGFAQSASYAALAATANSASYAALAGTAAIATQATNATNASFATLATNATEATFAETCTSASSAATLAGLSGDTSYNPDTVAVRDGSGDLAGRYMRMGVVTDDQSVGRVLTIGNNVDGYFRPSTLENFGAYLEARNITGRTGIAKTLSTSTPSGGNNGDIWYRY